MTIAKYRKIILNGNRKRFTKLAKASGIDNMDKNIQKGIITGVLSYVIWGLLPIFWKALGEVRADVVFSHRIVWSFLFLLFFIAITKNLKPFINECKQVFTNKKTLIAIILAALFIGSNWLVFIWAVQNDHVVQASLGYYINPLMSILLGVFILKERISHLQKLAVIIAAIAVIYLTVSYNVFPWIALYLSSSFAIYGLLKKLANLNATFSLMIETIILLPVAIIYLLLQFGSSFGFIDDWFTNFLLICTGLASSIPLLLFGMGVLYIPLSLVGILQYITPTLMLILGVLIYGEPFTNSHLITFIFIWISVGLYITSTFYERNRRRA